jgi:hypothetical protein
MCRISSESVHKNRCALICRESAISKKPIAVVFFRRRDFTALQNSTPLPRGGAQKSESNQARSAAFSATGGKSDANAEQ